MRVTSSTTIPTEFQKKLQRIMAGETVLSKEDKKQEEELFYAVERQESSTLENWYTLTCCIKRALQRGNRELAEKHFSRLLELFNEAPTLAKPRKGTLVDWTRSVKTKKIVLMSERPLESLDDEEVDESPVSKEELTMLKHRLNMLSHTSLDSPYVKKRLKRMSYFKGSVNATGNGKSKFDWDESIVQGKLILKDI